MLLFIVVCAACVYAGVSVGLVWCVWIGSVWFCVGVVVCVVLCNLVLVCDDVFCVVGMHLCVVFVVACCVPC